MNTPQTVFDAVWQDKLNGPRFAGYVAGENERVDAAAELLASGERLLDAGCGDGKLALAVKSRFKHVYGVDISEKAVSCARANGVLAKQADLSGCAFPFENQFFDAVTLLAVLPYVYDPDHVLRECHRVLRPGGTLLVGTANFRTLGKLYRIFVRGHFPITSKGVIVGCDGGAMHYFCSRDLRTLLANAGFSVASEIGVFYRPRFLGRVLPHLPSIPGLVREFFAGEILLVARRSPVHPTIGPQ